MPTADWNWLTHDFRRPSIGTKLLGGESYVTLKNVNMQLIVFGEQGYGQHESPLVTS